MKKISVILIVLAFILAVSSFILPDQLKKGVGKEGDYFRSDGAIVEHINVTENDKGYQVTYEAIADSDEYYDFSKEQYQYNDSNSSYYASIEGFFDKGLIYSEEYFEKEGVEITDLTQLKYIFDLVAFVFLTIAFIICLIKKGNVILHIASGLQIILLLVMIATNYFVKDYSGNYSYKYGTTVYDFTIDKNKDGSYSTVLKITESTLDLFSDLFEDAGDNYEYTYYVYDDSEVTGMGLKLGEDIATYISSGFRFVNDTYIVKKGTQFYCKTINGSKSVNHLLTKDDSRENRILITCIVLAVITAFCLIFSIIVLHKRKKVHEEMPYIPYGIYKITEKIFTAAGYEDFAEYAYKNLAGSQLEFNKNFFIFQGKRYDNAVYKKDGMISLPEQFEKSWCRAKVTEVRAEESLWYLLIHKEQTAVMTTIHENSLMLLKMEGGYEV